MDDNAAAREQPESDVGDAAANEDRNSVQVQALGYEVFDLAAIWIEPLANVLAFDTKGASAGSDLEEIEALFADECIGSDVLRGFLLGVEQVVAMLVEVDKTAEKDGFRSLDEGAESGDFQGLADSGGEASRGEAPKEWELGIEPLMDGLRRCVGKMEPGSVVVPDGDYSALANKAIADSREDVGIDTLRRWSRVAYLLFKGTGGCDAMGAEDPDKALLRDSFATLARQLGHRWVAYMYLEVWLAVCAWQSGKGVAWI